MGRILKIYIGFQIIIARTHPKIRWSKLNGSDVAVDVVTYGNGIYTGVAPHALVATGHSLERSPVNHDTNNCAVDFVDRNPPAPRN